MIGTCAAALAAFGLAGAAAGAPGGAGGDALRMLVGISIEQIEYADPPRVDTSRPFEALRPGDQVFVRVRALRVGEPPLARGQAWIGVGVPRHAEVAIAGRRGVRGCRRSEGVAVTCPITIKLRDDEEASVLLRITVPEGLTGPRLRIVANVGPMPDAKIRIAAKPKSVKVPLAVPGPAPPAPAPPVQPPAPEPLPAAAPGRASGAGRRSGRPAPSTGAG